MLSEGKTFLLRGAIFAVLASLVTTIIYLTPVPEIEFASCERPCHALMWPMICRITLTLEMYQSMSRACGDCPRNATDCFRRHCVSADGFSRGLITVDRQLPGPTINVCENDILLVDVVNGAPGLEASMHWRGQPQHEAPMMDGVPMVTQCPAPSRTTFQYKFRASRAGTHLYHAFTGSPAMESVFGALVVRRADNMEPHASLFDDDERVVVVSEWRHATPDPAAAPSPGAVLLNGRAPHNIAQASPEESAVGAALLAVRTGRRHRLRLAHAGGGSDCSVRLWAERHQLTLIELDGAPIEARNVASVTLAPGERADVILRADQRPGDYWLRAVTVGGCGYRGQPLRGAAVLRYEVPTAPAGLTPAPAAAADSAPDAKDAAAAAGTAPAALRGNDLDGGENTGPAPAFEPHCGGRGGRGEGGAVPTLCPAAVRAVRPPPEEVTRRPDVVLVLPFGFRRLPADNATAHGLVVPQRASYVRVPQVNNITFQFPSSPILTQGPAGAEAVCREGVLPAWCADAPRGGFCRCTHVLDVPKGAAVELLLINQGFVGGEASSESEVWAQAEAEEEQGDGTAVLHMHGHALHVAGTGAWAGPRPPSAAEARALDRRGTLVVRDLSHPVAKDTVAVPARGVVAARFKADNPGYWLLHEQRSSRWAAGLAVLIHVEGETPQPPADFPQCGSFVGPHFFLI